MAHPDKLTSWLLANSEQLNLQATTVNWVQSWKIDAYHDFQVKIDVGGQTFTGRGTAFGEDVAFLKAGAEAIERAYCKGHHIHTTGVAVHTDEDLAKEAVGNELSERDAFFCHFYTKTPFIPVESTYLYELMKIFKGVFDETLPLGIKFQLFRARSIGTRVFICIASGINAAPQFGGVIGLGAHSNEWRSIQAAFLECARSVAVVVLAGEEPATITEEEFQTILRPSAFDRQRLARNVNYWKTVLSLFPDSPAGPTEHIRPSGDATRISWHTERLECPFAELKTAPVHVYRARFDAKNGESLLRERDNSPTTLSRLEKFLGRPFAKSEIELKPHFLG
jgi:hypothetical protein